jgi:hypothetical protein
MCSFPASYFREEIVRPAVDAVGGTFEEGPVILKLIAVPVVLIGAWIFVGYLPTRNIATPPYAVLERKPGYEIRRYDRYVLAETAQGDEDGSSGFKRLFQFISGNNAGGSNLAMTAPVLKDNPGGGQKLSMTAPVLTREGEGGGMIAFVMPPGRTLAELPQPGDPKVTLREVAGHKAAVVSFSGFAGTAKLREKTEGLLRDLRKEGVNPRSAPVIALYNPPWTPPFMRRNEIMVEID